MTDRPVYLLAALICAVHLLDRIPGDGGAVVIGLLAAVFLTCAIVGKVKG